MRPRHGLEIFREAGRHEHGVWNAGGLELRHARKECDKRKAKSDQDVEGGLLWPCDQRRMALEGGVLVVWSGVFTNQTDWDFKVRKSTTPRAEWRRAGSYNTQTSTAKNTDRTASEVRSKRVSSKNTGAGLFPNTMVVN